MWNTSNFAHWVFRQPEWIRASGGAALLSLCARPGVLLLRVSGTAYAILFSQGLEADAAGYVASINAQVPGLVRASAANGRLTLETVATGAGATLSVSNAAFVARVVSP